MANHYQGEVRIISGKYKRKKIKILSPSHFTPTADRLKCRMFDLINQHLLGATVLDAFAGSGALGFEALSRGAERVDFFEKKNRS